MDNLILREWLNGALIPLNVCIIVMITYQLWIARKIHGKGWTRRKGVASACAFWWIFVAELIRSALAWHFLHRQGIGKVMPSLAVWESAMYAAAAGIAVAATFRLVYTLSPERAAHQTWLTAAGVTFVFLLLLWVLA